MHGIVHSADIQDRYGGVLLMASIFGLFPFLLKLYASGYQGPKFQQGLSQVCRQINVEIVKRSDVASSWSSPSARLSNAPSPGSIAVADWPKIGSASIETDWPSSTGLPSG